MLTILLSDVCILWNTSTNNILAKYNQDLRKYACRPVISVTELLKFLSSVYVTPFINATEMFCCLVLIAARSLSPTARLAFAHLNIIQAMWY